MISPEQAKAIIKQKITPTGTESVNISNAFGRVVSDNIFSPLSMPPLDQSAMDGYAFCYDDLNENKLILSVSEAAAGDSISTLESGHAIRIFTGAFVPEGADTVVMQEKISIEGNLLLIKDPLIKKGSNVRPKGSHFAKGSLLAEKGDKVTSSLIALIASSGINVISVYKKPEIGVIISGNELAHPGQILKDGEIFESNSFMIESLLNASNLPCETGFVKDNQKEMAAILKRFADKKVVLISGGISVGDYDFTLPALIECGYEIGFHKLSQKPGKPFCFAYSDSQFIFALPGNPASVFTCFHEYVNEALHWINGQSEYTLPDFSFKVRNSYSKKPGMTHFLKGYLNDNEVEILNGQESFRVDTLTKANCLVIVPSEVENINNGDFVNVHILWDSMN